MSRHTKYIQEMIRKLEQGYEFVESPDKLVTVRRGCCTTHRNPTKIVQYIEVCHYGTKILTISYDDSLRYISYNGRSFVIGEYAYSVTDARIINQFIEKYVPGWTAHSRKGEVIVN